ncbi:MAG: glycine cleavage system protein GcvH [Gammaproteobacteria bacterium]|nr:glycine cleavage system protein GcvH [Gammaproteobacteria bacterium]
MIFKYTEDHEWVSAHEDGYAIVGITSYAQELLGDVVYVELPKINTFLEAKSVAGVIESVKAAADIFCPISGTVIEINTALIHDPTLVNTQPQRDGWLFKLKIDSPPELDLLLDQDQYNLLINLHL